MPQLDDHAIGCWKRGQRAADLFASFARLINCLGSSAFICMPFVVQLACGLVGFELIEADVRCHAPDPRAKGAFQVEALESAVCTDEGFLGHIFSLRALMQDAI